MRTIKLIDMTLRETGAIRDNTLSFKEKLEIARILDRLKADVIELPPLSGSKADQLSNKTIASAVKTGLSAAIEIAPSPAEPGSARLHGPDGIRLPQKSAGHAGTDPFAGRSLQILL